MLDYKLLRKSSPSQILSRYYIFHFFTIIIYYFLGKSLYLRSELIKELPVYPSNATVLGAHIALRTLPTLLVNLPL